MTNQEWEQGMNELRDAQLATQRLIERNETSWYERFEAERVNWNERFVAEQTRWDERFETLTSTVRDLISVGRIHEQRLANVEEGIAEMRAALTSMMRSMDRFIRGQQSNGH